MDQVPIASASNLNIFPPVPIDDDAKAIGNEQSQRTEVDRKEVEPLLECALCLNLICEPISILCGHSFCRVCLVKSLRRSKKKCPTCRSVCHLVAEDAQENVIIKNLAIKLFPDIYSIRLIESEAEKSSWKLLLPIFYFNQCLNPGALLRLNFFEPRYRLMMQRIVSGNKKFLYVPNFANYQAAIGDIALIASLEEAHNFPEGTWAIQAKLLGRYIITDHYIEDSSHGLHYGCIEELVDVKIDSPTIIDTVNKLMVISQEVILKLFEGETLDSIQELFGRMPSSVEGYSLWLSSFAPTTEAAKLAYLKSTDSLGRLHAVTDLFINLLRRKTPMTQDLSELIDRYVSFVADVAAR